VRRGRQPFKPYAIMWENGLPENTRTQGRDPGMSPRSRLGQRHRGVVFRPVLQHRQQVTLAAVGESDQQRRGVHWRRLRLLQRRADRCPAVRKTLDSAGFVKTGKTHRHPGQAESWPAGRAIVTVRCGARLRASASAVSNRVANWCAVSSIQKTTRHAELVSASMGVFPDKRACGGCVPWMLKQVQHDEGLGGYAAVQFR
jgi:hypothetical protein